MPPFDWSNLAPLLGGLNPRGGGGFLEGWQKGQQEIAAKKEREQQQRMREEQLGMQRSAESRAVEDQGFQRQQHLLSGVNSFRQLLEDPTIDDPALFDQRMQFARQMAPQVGVDPGFLDTLKPAPDTFTKRKLTKLLDDFEKRPMSERQQAESAIFWEVGGQKYTPAQARQALGRGGMDARTGQPFAFTPPAQDTARPRALQQKDAMIDGRRAFVNFDPDTGKMYDASGQEVTNAQPIPPVSLLQPNAGGLPTRVQRQVDAQAKGFDSQPIVKQTQTMAQAVEFANSLDINTTNPADDQALIYAFAKAMDPDSVVREGEYATVQKYAQSWAERFGFDVQRIFSNVQFLTPQARQNMKATIQQRYTAAKKQYDNVRTQYASRINRMTGGSDGDQYLIDYGAAFPTISAPPASGAAPSAPATRGTTPNPFRR